MENVVYIDLGTIDYAECWEVQKQLFDKLVAAKKQTAKTGNAQQPAITRNAQSLTETRNARQPAEIPNTQQHGAENPNRNEATTRQEKPLPDQYVLLCEHPPVYTLGKSGNEDNMLVGEEFLKSRGASLFHVDRGGDITFHGPGQLVGYPILDLEREHLGLKEYVHSLEQAVIDTVAEFGITGTRIDGAAGVWLRDEKPLRKICAIGVRSSHYVTMHGFALNANTDLRWFDCINPCGFADRGAASIEGETGRKVDMTLLKELFLTHFQKIINIKINIEYYANRETLGNKAPG